MFPPPPPPPPGGRAGGPENYYHTRMQRLSGRSQRQRLPVAGVNRGWVVSRPGAALTPNDYAAAQWVLAQAYFILPLLVQKLNFWQNLIPVPRPVRELLHVYFKLSLDGNNRFANDNARNLIHEIGGRFMQIWAGIQADTELQIVDTRMRGTVNGYVNCHWFEDAGLPMRGRIHMNFQTIRPNDANTFRFFIHEASHKFARTEDHNGGCYFIAANLYELWQGLLNADPNNPVPWGPSTQALTAQQAPTHADSYGCFAENFRTLRIIEPRAPWI